MATVKGKVNVPNKKVEKEEKPKIFDPGKYLNVYEFETILPGSGETIKFKPLTTGIKKKLFLFENDERFGVADDVIDFMLKECVLNEDFDPLNLYIADKFFLTLEIRKKTSGENYKFNYTCSECDSQVMHSINLGELEITEIPENLNSEVKINDKFSVFLTHPTRKIQKESYDFIDNNGNDMTDSQKIIESINYQNALCIERVVANGEEYTDIPLDSKLAMLDMLSEEEYGKIGKWFDDNNFGVDFTQKIKCIKCGHEEEIIVTVNDFFFS